MKVRVLYFSKGGNTKKVAEAMAKAINQPVEAIPPAYPLENVKLLFLGSGVYGGKIDSKMIDFINTLNTNRVKNVALYGTSGKGDGAIAKMKEMLKAKGINVLEETFLCKGKYFIFLNSGHPNADELKQAQEFAVRQVSLVKE